MAMKEVEAKMKRLLMLMASVAVAAQAGAAEVVAVAKPQRVTETDGHVFVGRVMATQTVRLTARVTGTLLESNGDEGVRVKKGDVVLRIEDTVYRANLQTAKAQLAELEARLRHAETEVARYSAGAAKGGVSQVELDRAVLNRDVIKAQIEAAKAKVTTCEDDLARCVIRSPIDGVFGVGPVDAGNEVSPASGTLKEIFAIDPIDIDVAVPEAVRLDCMDKGGEKGIEKLTLLRANGKPYPIDLKVHAVSKRVEAATGTVKVTLRGANPDGALTPGGYVKIVSREVFKTPRLAVPMAAVVFEGEDRYAYVVVEGKAVKRKVVLSDQSGDLMFVGSGLTADDDVVVAGVHKLSDGAAVTVVKE